MMMRKLTVLAALLAATFPVIAQSEAWKNETLPIGERVEALLETLTVDEKIDKYYHGNEALHGIVRPGNFTVFPQAIALSAMWNPALLERISGVVSDEARARWNELERGKKQTAQYSDLLTFWSPTVNMARDPRWGRTPETYGEDPFLSGENGAAFVRGFQRVHLKRGETRTVTVSLRREDLRYWSDSRQAFVIPEGLPEIMVGTSSRDIRLTWPLE